MRQKNKSTMHKKLLIAVSLPFVTTAVAGEKEDCLALYQNNVVPFQELYQSLDPKIEIKKDTSVFKLTQLTPAICDTSTEAATLAGLLNGATSVHSGKVGVILNLSGDGKARDLAIVEGMKKNFPVKGAQFSMRMAVRDTQGSPAAYLHLLAELVFKEEVGIVIGGSSKYAAETLAPWAFRLKIPFIMLSHYVRDPKYYNPYLFSVYPNQESMAKDLIGYVVARRFKRVTVLQPNQRAGGILTQTFMNDLQRSGVEITGNFGYTPFDYASMEEAAKKVFKIDQNERLEEYKELYEKAKEEAVIAKVPFNESLVSLPPIIACDAIFIPDNFRMVRHFVKIFKYLGVRQMPLIGTQEWRAPELFDPYEPFLTGSVFVDYIGSYAELPPRITVTTKESPYFVAPDSTAMIDFEIIGLHAAHLADRALHKPPIRRRVLAKKLAGLTILDTTYFPAGNAFDEHNNARWPSFLFLVQDKSIGPLSMNAGYHR